MYKNIYYHYCYDIPGRRHILVFSKDLFGDLIKSQQSKKKKMGGCIQQQHQPP